MAERAEMGFVCGLGVTDRGEKGKDVGECPGQRSGGFWKGVALVWF